MLGDVMAQVRARRPRIHCITNYVTANDCANMVLAGGGTVIMADDPDEAAEVTAMCDGLVLNMGTPSPRRLEAMLRAGQEANRRGIPVVLDPVGVGCSAMRRAAGQRLMEQVRFTAIRGNATEIAALAHGTVGHSGVDADAENGAEAENARSLARQSGAVIVMSGEQDRVTDGQRLYCVANGHPMMRDVTGTGCQLSALLGAYVTACSEKPLEAALAAVCAMGLCGETAYDRLTAQEGNASYRNHIIDAMYRLTPQALEEGAQYDVEE